MAPKPSTHSDRRLISRLLGELEGIKTSFDSVARRRKERLLRRLNTSAILTAAELEKFHDLLCFLRAYPDSPGQLNRVERILLEFGGRIAKFKRVSGDDSASDLADSGIVGTRVSHTFSYDLTCAIARWYPTAVDIDWPAYNQSKEANLLQFLPLLVSWQENDSIDNDPDYDVKGWLQSAVCRKRPSTLLVLLHLLATSNYDHATARSLFENAQVPINWTLMNSPASRTLRRLPTRQLFFQPEPIRGRTRELRSDLRRPGRALRKVSLPEGDQYVRAIKEVLGVRCRELFPLIGSNPAEVYRYSAGRGVDIIIFGNNPDIRLPLESNFGAMLLRNGLPVGYGISAMLFDRAEIAINIFPAYRSGESSFIIECFFHLFVKHFGAQVLLVRSYQVGDDNEEAIESGSFWFYHKIGFRPVKPKVRKLAEAEARKVAARKGYRTPEAMLKRLAKSDVFFHLDPDQCGGYTELSLPNLGYAVSNHIRDRYDSNRTSAVAQSVKHLVSHLKITNLKQWSTSERIALERLAPLTCCIPDLNKWPLGDRKLLAKIIRAKGSSREREYVKLTLTHQRFQQAMHYLAEITRPPE
jgi:hypothetical protein